MNNHQNFIIFSQNSVAFLSNLFLRHNLNFNQLITELYQVLRKQNSAKISTDDRNRDMGIEKE